LDRKLRVIDSGAVVEHYDHVLRKHVKKRNKSLMVNFSVLSLEEGMLVLPKEEDEPIKLVGQMRGYMIKNITSRGEYSYIGEDHILDAFNLAMYGFEQNFSNLLSNYIPQAIYALPDPRMNDYPTRTSQIGSSNMFKNVSRAIRDPEYESIGSFQRIRRIETPSFGSRTTPFSNINFRRAGRGRIL
ncbi:MAG: hypothetical protein MUF59_08330, partial [Candidatus Krumholzibacteria bacterium]|nr:hypothetical protein [Candidatus Krumholzibacteria bacterium]